MQKRDNGRVQGISPAELVNKIFIAAAYAPAKAVLDAVEKSGRFDVNIRNKDGETLLHVCARYGREKEVREFLEAGVNPNLTDTAGRLPSDVARDKGFDYIANILASMETDCEDGDAAQVPAACASPRREPEEEREEIQMMMF